MTPLQNAHRRRGIGTYVRGLAARLNEQSEVPIEFWGWKADLPLDVRPPHRALLISRFPMPEYRGVWAFAQIGMKLRARRSRAPIVHFTDPNGLVCLSRRRLAATVYDLIPLLDGIPRRQALAALGYRRYIRTLRQVETVFAISEATRADLVEHLQLPGQRVKVARPGTEVFAEVTAAPKPEHPFFLYLGGPNQNKNLPLLLEAMAVLHDELPQELLVVGEWLPRDVTWLTNMVSADTRLADRVRYLGYLDRNDLMQLVPRATALVLPSKREGFGLPLAEGLALGAVVIHSQIPVLVETAGNAGLAFGPDSIADLAGRMRQASLLSDAERQKMAERARARASRLTWDDAVSATLTAYRVLLGWAP